MTDKGVAAILEHSESLQSLTLTEVEGRLNRMFWSKLAYLPKSLRSVRVALNEEGPHHSWISDHLTSIFDALAMAPSGLLTFSLTRITPKGNMIPVTCKTQDGMVLCNGNGKSGQATMLKRVFASACDEAVRPRPFPEGAITRIVEFGACLEVLELDFFAMSMEELRKVLESCKKLRSLRILLDATLTKVLAMSSAFVPLNLLHTLVVSVTDTNCPSQTQMVKASSSFYSVPSSALPSPNRRRASQVDSRPDFSAMSMADRSPVLSESRSSSSPHTPVTRARNSSVSTTCSALQHLIMSSTSMVGMEDAMFAAIQGTTGDVGFFDTSVPPKRDIRKFARRCPSLRVIRWTGRNGKGEWRIAAGSSHLHTRIDFIPIQSVEDDEAERSTLRSGADVEEFVLRKRRADMAHPGQQSSVSVEEAVADGRSSAAYLEEAHDETRKSSELKTMKDTATRTKAASVVLATPREKETPSPRTRSNAAPQALAGHTTLLGPSTSTTTALEETGKKTGSLSLTKRHDAKVLGAMPCAATAAKTSTDKRERTYAAISSPTVSCRVEVPVKMTVLGESNTRRKVSSGPLQNKEALVKGHAMTKFREAEDGHGVATIIIGQGKPKSTTSGAAGRRTKKKMEQQQMKK
ncbi:hypothetical protein CBS101457_003702 [Exobasidium rhododendri]|nr:hypothetical protein CBS101457_003702 [Exobasidium rhododendri]